MIEVIAVLIVMAIFASVVASRYTPIASELRSEVDGLKASLRYAQIQSLTDDTATSTSGWGIHFSDDGKSYMLYKDGAPAVDGSSNPVLIPVKVSDAVKDPPPANTHKLQGNVQITAGAGTTVTYNNWGSPGPALTEIELSDGVSKNKIAITPETGFIYVP